MENFWQHFHLPSLVEGLLILLLITIILGPIFPGKDLVLVKIPDLPKAAKKACIILWVPAFVILILSCWPFFGEKPNTQFKARVVDRKTGRQIPGIKILVADQKLVTSDSLGEVRHSVESDSIQELKIKIEQQAGYLKFERTLPLSISATSWQTIELEKLPSPISSQRLYNDGNAFYTDGKFEMALPLLKKSAKLGNIDAGNVLGTMYLNGYGTPQNISLAESIFHNLAMKHDRVGEYNYGIVLHLHRNRSKDAVEWFKLSAQKNYPVAIWQLGYMFENGFGIQQNYHEALKNYERAFDLGYGPAKRSADNLRPEI